jgi:hypothetical protein
MQSEKLTYWMTLGVLALATTTGFVNEHRGWGDRLAVRSVALVSQASVAAANYATNYASNYAEIAGMAVGSEEADSAGLLPAAVDVHEYVQNEVQARLACVQRTLVRRQAEMIRLQAMRVQVRARAPRNLVWSDHRMVIEVPQAPEPSADVF